MFYVFQSLNPHIYLDKKSDGNDLDNHIIFNFTDDGENEYALDFVRVLNVVY